MHRSRSRFFPLFLVAIVVIIIIVAIISIARAIFSGSQQTDTSSNRDIGRDSLLDTSGNHSVKLVVRGPIVANENFTSYSIEVSPSNRNMTVFKGYLDSAQKSKNLDNNTQAYEQFVYALDKANMMKGTMPDNEQDDLRGICATGYIYDYSVLVDNSSVKHLWTSTCGGSRGTLNASVEQLNNLFLTQIPDSDELNPFGSLPSTQLHL